MKGTWQGYYEYGTRFLPENYRQKRTRFTIEILEHAEASFKGEIQDDVESGGMEGTGSIRGELRDGIVRFIKEMPFEGFIMPNGEVKTRKRKHPKIYYEGRMNNDGTEAKGMWRFKIGFTWIGVIPMLIIPIKGRWKMKKEQNVLQ